MNKNTESLGVLDIISIVIGVIAAVLIIAFSFLTNHEFAIYILFTGTILLLGSCYFVYKAIEKKSGDNKQKVGSIWLAFVVSLFIYILSNLFAPLAAIEESSVSWRFTLLRGGITKSEKEAEDSGKIEYTRYNPPKGARQDIHIIGITTNTLEKLQGTWPLPWQVYSKVIDNFRGSADNALMFDIFLVDYKKGQMESIGAALDKNRNVMFDYPMETSNESRDEIQNLNARIDLLRKFKFRNVIDKNDQGVSWVKFPVPPIEQVSGQSAGLGFANIKKDESGLNRKMPLVVKLYNSGPNKETEYYPSIDFVLACKYYGVDPQRDTEVVMGEYVKIKNIPKKEISSLNRKTFKMETRDLMHIPNEKREIVIPIDWEGQMEINFVGGRYSFLSHELFEVATEWTEETVSQFKNTIFLVAMYYATGRGASKDSHLSPFGDMSGIEHHAHALNTILNQDFLRSTPAYVNLFIFLVLGLLVGFIQPRVPTWLGFILILVSVIIYSVIALFAFNTMNLIVVFPSALIEQVTIFVGIIGFKILTEEENVKYIRNTFSKFVSKDIVDELLKNPTSMELGGSKKEITIFFSDVRGFTTMSESLGPEELVKFLNDYLSVMTEIIIEYKGTIDKYMGDAIMAFWGAPVPLEDHAYYSCVASLYQMQELRKMQDVWRQKGMHVIDIGIGLNTGMAVVGNMGSSHRMDYTVMGDTINLGSRLEGSNKMYGTNIIMSEYTYEKVKDKVIARELDLVKVKGKNQPVRIYELLGLEHEADMELLKRPIQGAVKQ